MLCVERKNTFRGLNFFPSITFLFITRAWLDLRHERANEVIALYSEINVVALWCRCREWARRESEWKKYSRRYLTQMYKHNYVSKRKQATILIFSMFLPRLGATLECIGERERWEKFMRMKVISESATLANIDRNINLETSSTNTNTTPTCHSNKPKYFERTCSVFFELWNWERLIRVVRVFFNSILHFSFQIKSIQRKYFNFYFHFVCATHKIVFSNGKK